MCILERAIITRRGSQHSTTANKTSKYSTTVSMCALVLYSLIPRPHNK